MFARSHSHIGHKAAGQPASTWLHLTCCWPPAKCGPGLHGDAQSFHYATVCSLFFFQVLLAALSIIFEKPQGKPIRQEGVIILWCACVLFMDVKECTFNDFFKCIIHIMNNLWPWRAYPTAIMELCVCVRKEEAGGWLTVGFMFCNCVSQRGRVKESDRWGERCSAK